MLNTGFIWEKAASVVEPRINAEGIHIWPFDVSFPLDVRFMILGGPNHTRVNRHEYFELAYIFSGTAGIQIRDRYYTANKGNLLVIGSDIYHRMVSSPQRPARLAVLYFEPDLIRGSETNGDDAEYLMPFIAQNSEFPHVINAAEGIPAEAFEVMKRIKQHLPPASNRARLTIKAYLKAILATLLNYYSSYIETQEAFKRKEATHQRLRPLFEYMDAHYTEPITICAAARVCAMSNSHFMYFFKKVTGQSFLAYLTHFRIAKAQEMLISTVKPISEICQELAFCNQSYFGMVFRKVVGLTPLAYRRRFTGQSGVETVPAFGPLQGNREAVESACAGPRREAAHRLFREAAERVLWTQTYKNPVLSKSVAASRSLQK